MITLNQEVEHMIFGKGKVVQIEQREDKIYTDPLIHTQFENDSLDERVFNGELPRFLLGTEDFNIDFYTKVQNEYDEDARVDLYKKYHKQERYNEPNTFWEWLEEVCF